MSDTLPPNEWLSRHHWHWLKSERASAPSLAEWLDGAWYCMNEVGRILPQAMAARGWRYWKPVEAPGDPNLVRTVWVNAWRSETGAIVTAGQVYDTREEADRFRRYRPPADGPEERIACVPVTFVEGEGIDNGTLAERIEQDALDELRAGNNPFGKPDHAALIAEARDILRTVWFTGHASSAAYAVGRLQCLVRKLADALEGK